MIMLTVTKPRRKLKRVLQGLALLLLLGVVVPGIYHSLEAVGAMSMFASGEAVTSDGVAPVAPEAPIAQEEATETETAAETETTAEAEAVGEGAEQEQPEQSEQPTEQPGLWQSLRAVIFGEKPQVNPY